MVKILLIILVIAILMDDSASIRKTEEEKKEEEEIAKAVNATLEAEEAKRKKEEEDEKKKQLKEEKKKDKTEKKKDKNMKEIDQDEAGPLLNSTCPSVDPCPEEQTCPEERACPPCEDCPPVRDCGPCSPCGPCPKLNNTQLPSTPDCPEVAEVTMSVPVAMLVGAMASLLVTGVAAAIGLLLRYVSPIVSGFLFLATIVILWYLCSQYPETAREMGGRLVATLREASIALGHRVMEAIRHHNEQVGLFLICLISSLRMSSIFHWKNVCTKIFYVEKN
jgi:hypothetical protein